MGLMHIPTAPPVQPVDDAAYWARMVTACTLVEEISDALDVPADSAWTVIAALPGDNLALLDSPQGWRTLAGQVGVALGVSAAAFSPSVH